ncbi:MAG: formate dehydrogenase accessory sulfurtransferase FdhD [Candidatus Zixiibacteriota bacterium]|nr:MAG: formate dehydrogenase accessory sulfurtransferase FdhD [candidate division Zixibacteria bacterium]
MHDEKRPSPEDKVSPQKATRIKDGNREEINETVAQEAVLRISLNDREVVALSCTPYDQAFLAAGFLASEGFLKGRDEIKSIDQSEGSVTVRTDASHEIPEDSQPKGILTSGCGKGKTFADWENVNPLEDIMVNLDLTLSPNQVLELMSRFEERSGLFRQTGGVHSAALAGRDDILLFNEDIGRHNAVDKILGEALLKGIDLKDKLLVTSGRVSSDIISKLWNCGLSVVVSRTAPTSLAVKMAQKLGITIAGFVRGKRMNVYSFPARIQ